tara:strand:- start:1 stop:933 length:933 start_codon:yes stop_codon:yes gene_type:complete
LVLSQVKSIAEMGAYVSLLEYRDIEGMILLSELSRRRIRSIGKLLKVGRVEPVMVLRVDEDKGYIDLSKRRVSPEDVAECEERYNKSKMVHSIMRHTAETTHSDLETLYKNIAWPLYRKYGHAFDAFRQMVTNADSFFSELVASGGAEAEASITEPVRDALTRDIKRRMTPTPLKLRADVELTCFQYDGVLQIQEAMRAGERRGEEGVAVKVKLVAPPLYVLTSQTLLKDKGLRVLGEAIEAMEASIEGAKGKLTVKEAPRAVSERDDRLLAEHLEKLEAANREVEGDDDEDAEQEGQTFDVTRASAMQM